MSSIFDLKEQQITDTPLLLFDCELADGRLEHWSTHQVTYGGNTYSPRVLRHNLFEIQTSSDQGVDAIPRVSLVLANADSHFSELERSSGCKGADLSVQFLFYDLRRGVPTSDTAVLFRGVTNPPEQITEATFQLSAINRMNMQRVLLPHVRIQRRCPWLFPANAEQRLEALNGGESGQYSPFYRCGYSADVPGGMGELIGGAPYTSCGYTRLDCDARGMFREAKRFGGIEFVPSSILVRGHGDRGSHYSPVAENQARYNDFVPLLYGTAWYAPPIVFSRNDGNLTHMEVLLGMGPIQAVQKVLVNGIEIPLGKSGANMTATGWYNVLSPGSRSGAFNPDFADAAGNPAGDPYGSMAYLGVVVPNQINDGNSLPTIKVLADGLQLPVYGSDGSYVSQTFTANPAWILLDILRRSGWATDQIDVGSFAAAAAFCDQKIETQDLFGNKMSVPRFQCNLFLQKRRNAGDLIRGIRNASRLLFTYGIGGLLRLEVENSLALQQPAKPDGSNSTQMSNGGWPAYEFSDGSVGISNILRRTNGEPSVRVLSRSITDTPNQVAVEFQDAFNEYQQDSLLLVDVDDTSLAGQVITSTVPALGIPNYDQAARILKFTLDKSIRGNTYIEFESSVKALGLCPGDIITVTYLKEGFQRQPFRILKMAPSANYRTIRITAQIHQDSWYEDTNGQMPGDTGARRQADTGIGIPRPLLGNIIDADGNFQYEIIESSSNNTDAGVTEQLTAEFLVPPTMQVGGPAIPLLSLSATIIEGGTLDGDQILYYAVTAVDGQIQESALSFVVRARVPPGSNLNAVRLAGLSFASGTESFHVYRGVNPSQMYRIASKQPLAEEFTDLGLTVEAVASPDPAFDHANFYWRLELQPEYAATIAGPDTIGNADAEMADDHYTGMVVRITRGKGSGQERTVASNSSKLLNIGRPWDVQPDATSYFVIAEAGWHFGVASKTSPVQFQIPNRAGAVLHIQGRAANVNDLESPAALSTLTRWTVGGGGLGDTDIPPEPMFGLGPSSVQSGAVELTGVGFKTLTNTRSITAGTLTLHYWDELTDATTYSLDARISTTDTVLKLSRKGVAMEGAFVQIEAEIMRVDAVQNEGLTYQVTRGMHGTTPVDHDSGVGIYHLSAKISVVPFPLDFFGSPLSGVWSHPVMLANTRLSSAEFFVVNSRGNGPTGSVNLTGSEDNGLRILAGGQFSFQVEGFLAVDSSAAPSLVVESAHSVRDVCAVVKQGPVGGPIELVLSCNGSPYCALTIPDGSTVAQNVNGFGKPLAENDQLSLSISSVGRTNPGSDLTVTVRL